VTSLGQPEIQEAELPPSGPLWVHEIKHDGYRLIVCRDGARVRCFTRNGQDWADRFPAVVEAASHLRATSFLIDGEVVIARYDGTPDFYALRSKHRAAVVSGAKSWRWPLEPQRTGLAARSTVAAVTVPVWPRLAQRTANDCGRQRHPS
jgi:ATP-dependent DNA ligase